MSSRTLSRPLLAATVALLAIGASLTSLPNQFVQDDIAVVFKNDDNHSLQGSLKAFSQPYWPKPFSRDLYRPLMSVALTTQWVAGGGRPVAFRVTSIVLYALSAVAFFWCASLLLPPAAAWIAAALFAVHPVHTEAVAVAVNQAELIVGLAAAVALGVYLRARNRGEMDARTALGLIALYLTTCFFKENAVILPGLMLAAELTVVRGPRPLRARLGTIGPLMLGLGAAGLAFLAVRSAVLGSVVGTFTAEALQGLTPGQRALTMLGVVPEWLRLLAWPAHLQADYSPREIVGAPGWGSAQTVGLALLAVAMLSVVATWRRMPVVAFGILWLGISLFPVSNVLVPTGIVLAERALFLPSLGFLLVIGALADGVQRELRTAEPVARWAAAATLGILILAGGLSSARRQRTWKDAPTQFNQLLLDAPLSYRAHYGIASLLWEDHQHDAAELEYRRALELFPRSYVVPRDLADHLRLEARCDEAIPLYVQTIANAPGLTDVRSSMIACLVYVGRYRDAHREALAGLALNGGGADSTNFRNFAATAERALLAETPAGTVRLTVVPQAGAAPTTSAP